MTNDRPVYILSLVNIKVYWPIIGHLYCMTSLFIRHCKLLQYTYPMFDGHKKYKPCFWKNVHHICYDPTQQQSCLLCPKKLKVIFGINNYMRIAKYRIILETAFRG